MSLKASAITESQFTKIRKALVYSASSGFVGGFLLSISGLLTTALSTNHVDLGASFAKSLAVAAVLGGVTGAINTLAVTVKQVFTPSEGN